MLIKDVRTHTPAAEAGLQALDYIIKADSTNITSSSDLLGFVARTPVGTKIDLTILRPVKFKSPKEMKVTIKVAERPSEKILSEQMRGGEGMGPGTPAPAGEKMLGMSVEPTQYNGIDVLKVTGVERRSPAASAGLRAGDIITKFDGEPVSSVDQLKSAIANQPKGRPHWVEFVRQGQRNLTTIPQ
ncbi:MAG: PDZ domain-containing protein [bacterium]|nr:PDZ domain-containing protein [bacterium]